MAEEAPMKKILSISLGSSDRNHTTRHEFLGQECELSRIGTDGDFDKAIQMYRDYDGKVDAFGVGGIMLFLQVAKRRYYFRDGKRISQAVTLSKIGDGNGVRDHLEQRAFAALEKHLNENEGKTLRGMSGLHTTAVDRYGMAEAMVAAGLDMIFGDFMFTLGLPISIKKLSTVRFLAGMLLPVMTQLPFKWFYPIGSEQDLPPEPKWHEQYQRAQVIAGDFLQIYKSMPDDLSGKIIVTNTTTEKNVEELRKRHLHLLVTSTPRLEGRSFGTNVMEATLLALMDKPKGEVIPADFAYLIDRIPLKPNIEVLN
jgi:hypothetical protein